MKLAKGFILAVTGLLIVMTLFSLLIPSKVMTVRTAVIHTTADKAFAEISDLQKWKHWHPVFMQGTSAIRFSEPSTGVNAFAEWESNGKTNKLLITQLSPNKLQASLIRVGENPTENIISITALKDSNNVQAEWRTLTRLKWYPWEKFSGMFVERITGPGYEAALNNLKELLEGKQ
jgi:hypothetical protein